MSPRPLRPAALAALLFASSQCVPATLAAQFEGCTWERCAAQLVPTAGGHRVVFGTDSIALGWRGTAAAARLSRASDAAPHAARMVRYRTRGVPLSVIGSIAAPIVLVGVLPEGSLFDAGNEPSGGEWAALLAGVTVDALGDIEVRRAGRELHHAVWRHNRQLAMALRRTPPDSLPGALRGCVIERCGVRVRVRGAFGGVQLVRGDAGPQVTLTPFSERAVAPLFAGVPEAERDVARWGSSGRQATWIALGTAVASVAWFFAYDGSNAARVWGAFGIGAVGTLATVPSALESERALQRAVWRLNGELAR